MANTYVTSSINIGSGRIAVIQLRDDVATYFGITADSAGELFETRRRKAHTRGIYDGLNDTTAQTTNVSASTWIAVKRAARIGSGRAVKVPTKLKTANDNIRYVTIRFPANAVVAAISEYLYSKIDTAKRPDFFVMPSGARYPVTNIIGDVNPGEGPEPPTS